MHACMHACMSLRCTSTCTCKCKKWRKRMYPRAMTLLVIMIIKFLKFHMYMYVLIKEPYTLVHVWNKKIRTLISWHHACMQQTKLINIRACMHACIKTKLINIRACMHACSKQNSLIFMHACIKTKLINICACMHAWCLQTH